MRDEHEQAREIVDLLNLFREAGVDTVFVNTFVCYSLPHREGSRQDLDLASYGIVKVVEQGGGTVYPGMPWEPKVAFTALADSYRSI